MWLGQDSNRVPTGLCADPLRVVFRYRPSPSGAELIEALQPLIAWSGHRRELVT
jgi:hypothetical protein